MKGIFKSRGWLICLISLSAGIMYGCTSGETDGGEVDHSEGAFSADDDSTGGISLEFPEGDELAVADIMGFRVFVRDSDGQPVTNIEVTCDTETGLGLIEPTTGTEITDGDGQISGKVGCNILGSYQIACRPSAGTSARVFETVKCTGLRPDGFTGFPNAGGGGLGGGSAFPDSRLRINTITISDQGQSGSATTSIDIVQDTCDASGTPTPEEFFDSHVVFALTNDGINRVRVTGYKYKVADAFSSGSSFTSSTIALQGEVPPNGGELTVPSALLFDARSGAKGPVNTSQNFVSGFKTVTFTVFGEDDFGNSFSDQESITLSFDDFNNCD